MIQAARNDSIAKKYLMGMTSVDAMRVLYKLSKIANKPTHGNDCWLPTKAEFLKTEERPMFRVRYVWLSFFYVVVSEMERTRSSRLA